MIKNNGPIKLTYHSIRDASGKKISFDDYIQIPVVEDNKRKIDCIKEILNDATEVILNLKSNLKGIPEDLQENSTEMIDINRSYNTISINTSTEDGGFDC